MTKKLLAVLLAVLMIVTMIPMNAFAAETEPEEFVPTVVNGEYDANGNWAPGGSGTKVYTVKDANGNDSTLELSKTATPVEGMPNCYDITLKVETSTNTVTLTNAGAVVLVIDVSNSMKYCAECGGENGHASGYGSGSKPQCTYYNRYDNGIKTEQTRMTAAINAAINFLNSYAGSDTNAVRMVSVVTFGSTYNNISGWKNIAGKANDYQAVVDAINGMATPIKFGWNTQNGGTNLEAGLVAADDLLSNDAIKNIESKNVVLLTDGKPTYRLSGSNVTNDGSGSGTSENEYNEAISAASSVKSNPTASLYTVCFGASTDIVRGDETVGEYLKNKIASSGCAHNADNTAALNSVFAAISEKITNGIDGSGTTVTDPMADKISVQSAPAAFTAEDGTNYQWKLSNAKTSTEGNVTTYVYELTYRIKLNVYPKDFIENSLYPTNGRTYLNLEDGTKLEFPVPGVTGSIPRESFEIKKIWDDNNNVSGFRTDDAQFILKSKGDVIEDQPFEIKKAEHAIGDNEWVYVVENARIHDYNGNIIEYYVEEILPEGSVYRPVNDSNLVIRNVYVPETTSVTVTKVWEDNNNNDGFRPESLTVKLFANGVATDKVVTLSEENEWTATFTELLKYSEGKEIDYTVEEVIEDSWKDKYTAAAPVATNDGYSITNSHTDETIDLEITKIWKDNNNNDGKRPASIQVQIYKTVGETVTLVETVTIKGTADDTWTYTREGLPKYEAGTEIVYTVKEVAFEVEGNQYKDSVDGTVITNTRESDLIDVSVKKVWDDNGNEEGFRPESITVKLLADGVDTGKTATLKGTGNEWTYTFEDLAKYEAGKEIVYTVEEVAVENYETTINGDKANGFTITNSREVEKTEVTVTKVWVDDNNRDGIRPDSITVKLLANGTQVVATTELTDGNLTFTFDNLNVYKDGEAIQYTVEEVAVNGYESAITGTAANGYTITNTHAIETTTVSGTKTWVDDGDRDGIRPEKITVNLLANGTEVDEATVTAENGWAYTFENLPVNENGEPIKYEVTEDAVDGYKATVDGYNITNTHEVALKDITVTKTWVDDNNRDGVRPEAITVTLLGNGAKVAEATFGGEGNEWSYKFEGLFVKANGEDIVYTIEEADIEVDTTKVSNGYEATIKDFAITNTHEIEKIEVNVEKVWDDEENRDGIRPENLGIILYADGVQKDTLTLDSSWKGTFEDLAKYRDGGVEIVYTVEEVELPDGYQLVSNVGKTAYDYVITNKHDPDKVAVMVTKDWADSDNIEGFRPESITVELLANGEKVDGVADAVLNEENNWQYKFDDLYKFENGEAIVYTVKEAQANNYKAPEYDLTKDENGNVTATITNARDVEYRDITVTKIWDDSDNEEGFRPEKITVNLLKGDEVIDAATLEEDANGKWTATFKGLQKYENGEEVQYTVEEVKVPEYETVIDGSMAEGFTVTNSRKVLKTSVSVSKSWVDGDNVEGFRTEKVTVNLLANGTEVDEVELSNKNGWAHTFTDLNVYADGEAIVYEVTEDEVANYETEITGSAADGYVVTNSREVEKTEVTVSKVWDDADNVEGFRTGSVTVNLLANGEVYKTVELSAENKWTYTFIDLNVYANGEEVEYTVTEDEVANYETEITYSEETGYTVTNSRDVEKTEVTVTKVWVDESDRDGARPETITVKLLANGTEAREETFTGEGDQWTYTFTGLNVYANGEEIEYTVQEVLPEDTEYTVTYGDDNLITNTYDPKKTAVTVEKLWEDDENRDGIRPETVVAVLYANGEVYGEAELSEENQWTYTFENLYVYENKAEIVYSVEEFEVAEGYEAEVSEIADGVITITNTHEIELTEITVEKVWEDDDNNDGIRPESVTVTLLGNGEAVAEAELSEENQWTYTFEELPVYTEGEVGKAVEYTFEEAEVEGYESEFSDIVEGKVTLTNTHENELTNIIVEKVWSDDDNNDGLRATEIAVQLYANGQKYGEYVVLSEENAWTYTFENLEVFAEGELVEYTVLEADVEGYEASYSEITDGKITITNTRESELVDLVITKLWEDQDNEEKVRPESVEVELYANGELLETVTLTAEGEWKYELSALKYAEGVEVEYTIKEANVPADYEAEYDQETLTVTNTLIKKVPQTGDYTNMNLYIVLAAVSFVGFGVTLLLKKKEEN
ncbi:MAG: Cna B-type domain-containing protein [Ruminococcaceae bacterium]|nr:Cna B-type domain-containing protein [Oscillospiraceae bacterium]